MKRVLILGGSGLLGSSLSFKDFQVIKHGFTASKSDVSFNVLDKGDLSKNVLSIKPDYIINLVALTNVDECELNPQKAYLLNVRPVEFLVDIHRDCKFHLIQISTDQVYDGIGPHKEDHVSLSNYYAYSKYLAESVSKSINGTVLRTNFFGRSKVSGRKSFTDWIFESSINDTPLKLFTDVFFSPLSMQTISNMMTEILKNPIPGVFNLGSTSGLSKRDFVHLFAGTLGLSTKRMEDALSDSIKLAAYRPKDMRMDSSFFTKSFFQKLPNLEEEIIKVAGEYNEQT